MNLELSIAKRYLFSKKSTNAINIISMVSGLAMLFGTLSLILILSVFNGLEGLVKSLYTVFYPDIAITASAGKTIEITDSLKQQLNSISYIDAYSFSLEENALLEYGDRQYLALVRGVDEQYFNVVKPFDTFMIEGKRLLQKDSINYCILGIGVAQKLGVNTEQAFQPLAIYMPNKDASSFASMENAFKKSYINTAGAFAVSDEFDSRFTFVPLDFFQQLTGNYSQSSQISIRLKDSQQSDAAIALLKQKLGNDYTVKSRYQQNEVLYKILKSEKWVTFFILVLIMIIASFNIIGALSMLVLEKKKDIATLTALGIRKNSIVRIFVLEGLLMSIAGAIVGMALGLLLCYLQQTVGLVAMPGSSFLVKYYPVKVSLIDISAVTAVVILISLLAAYLPAKKAAKAVEKDYLDYLS